MRRSRSVGEHVSAVAGSRSRMFPGVPAAVWGALDRPDPVLLSFDHDGTLAPFHADRDRARPSAHVLAAVAALAEAPATHVAIVSGRPLASLPATVRELRVMLVGEHGWEGRAAEGAEFRHDLAEAARARLAEAAADPALAPYVECKRTSVALHVRGLARAESDRLLDLALARWQILVCEGLTQLVRFDGGMELRALGHDKGSALVAMLHRLPPGAYALHVGDDLTDEDAFAALAGTGAGILVGAPLRPTRAVGRLDDIAQVGRFVDACLEARAATRR